MSTPAERLKLLIFPAIDADRLRKIAAISPQLTVINAETQDSARTEIVDADAFYGKITRELLAAARQLRWIQSPTASLEHYLFPELIAHPATLTNMRGLFSDVIADHVLGYILMFARNLHLYRDAQRERRWAPVGDANAKTDFVSSPGVETPIDRVHRHLSDCTMGVVGVGAIGAEIARRGAAFGMTVLGVDPHPVCVPGIIEEAWPLFQLPELLSASEFVVIAAPHTPSSEGLFDAGMIAHMRPDSYLINIGRGAIVDLAALTEALQQNRIAGAALDVVETEPLPESHPLWRMPNVLITPHTAAASPRVPQRHLATLLENVRRFVAGEELRNVVTKEEWC